jgi:hypothetical protein
VRLEEFVFIVGYYGGIVVAWAVPWFVKRQHNLRQNHLIEVCRARFILAVQHLASNNEPAARVLLLDIRAVEDRWHYGNSAVYRIALGCKAIGLGTVLATASRVGPLVYIFRDRPSTDWIFIGSMAALCAAHTLFSYFGDWHSHWIVDDCGDRLEALLNAGRGVDARSPKSKRGRLEDGLAAREVFGLEPGFALKDLNAARRRMAALYHPDRLQTAPASATRAAEDAMKRINAAYDELKSQAT